MKKSLWLPFLNCPMKSIKRREQLFIKTNERQPTGEKLRKDEQKIYRITLFLCLVSLILFAVRLLRNNSLTKL